jgi:hypothetical protein
MAHLPTEIAFERFRALGRNSSHFVWFLTKMQYFETSQGWVFGYLQRGTVTLFALEPLMPDPARAAAEFPAAWAEVVEGIQPKISFFISVYDGFLQALKNEGFQALQVGKEPYVDLANCIPTGKSGKGVRAARNQALRAGVTVEAWAGEKIQATPKIRDEMAHILAEWKSRKAVDLGGFLNAVNPFEKMNLRRYFLAFSKERRLEGFLVGTPIPAAESWFLEDLVLRHHSARGAGELLTLEAMITLAEAGGKFASLGVVSMTSMTKRSAHALPPLAELALVSLPYYLRHFYNVAGLETFRKRFKPQRWENVHLALRNHPSSGVSDDRAWLRSFRALIGAFAPRLNRSWDLPLGALKRLFEKHPVSTVCCTLSTLSFALVNRFGTLPDWALKNYGFSGDTPFWEWYYRTVTSDFLFFDWTHYLSSVVFLFFFLRWMERSYPIKFGAMVVAGACFIDDFVNQLVLVAPYSYFQPRLFQHLVAIKDVGPSLWIALVLGLQLCTMRKHREILFAVVSVSIILVFAFSANHLTTLILNLNHSLFFALGFILGKIRFEYERMVSRRVARQKPPVAKSVAGTPQRRASDRKGPAAPPDSVPVE